MKNKFTLTVLAIMAVFTFQMCEDTPELPAYVGSWETDVFYVELGGQQIPQKMSFDFEETSFEAHMKIVIGASTQNALGVRGSVSAESEKVLGVSLTEIGEYKNDDFDWKTKANEPQEFQALYDGYLSEMLPQEFNTTWNVDGNNLSLIIPVASDTIFFHKK